MATLDGIMDYLADHSSDVKIVVKSGTTTIPANSHKDIDCTTECGTGSLSGVNLKLDYLGVPYIESGTVKTWVSRIDSTSFRIQNTASSAWTNYAYTAILFISP